MKICGRCKVSKEEICFGKSKRSKDGLRNTCKECRKIEGKERYRKHKEKVLFINKRYRDRTGYNRKYYLLNKETINENGRQYYYDNKEKIIKRMLDRYDNDPLYKLILNIRRRIIKVIKRNQKSGSAIEDLGCSAQELKQRFEKMFYPNPETGEQMSWDNYGKKWHIDHIIPLASFDLTNREQFLKACHYTNLQPLWVEDHRKKTIDDINYINTM